MSLEVLQMNVYGLMRWNPIAKSDLQIIHNTMLDQGKHMLQVLVYQQTENSSYDYQ